MTNAPRIRQEIRRAKKRKRGRERTGIKNENVSISSARERPNIKKRNAKTNGRLQSVREGESKRERGNPLGGPAGRVIYLLY